MSTPPRNWRPGIFTRNFAWGTVAPGLRKLHEAIRVGFAGTVADVERQTFLTRVLGLANASQAPIVTNFFLFNYVVGATDHLLADELVRQALIAPHSKDFDRLALFALNLSMAGQWHNSEAFHANPSEWSKHFIVSQVASTAGWNTAALSAPAIRTYIESSPSYDGTWASKGSTNLNYIYELGDLAGLPADVGSAWRARAVFLAIDRLTKIRGWTTPQASDVLSALLEEHVFELLAVSSFDGQEASRKLIDTYLLESAGDRSGTSDAITVPVNVAFEVGTVLGDETKPVERVYASASRQVRNRKLVARVRSLYGDKCAACGVAVPMVESGKTYCEVGHVKPVGFPLSGPDHESNVLPFCPNHHRQFDRGAIVFHVTGTSAQVIDRSHSPTIAGRVFTPAAGHVFDMANLAWHEAWFA